MPFIKLLVHAVWATKDRKPLLNKANKDSLCLHIRNYAAEKNIHLINVNGWLDHLHCFISLSADQNMATVMNLIKGESSFWANRNLKWTEKFGWQDDYFAVSVGESQFNAVNNYINNQEQHHKKKSFQQEYDEFIKNYHFEE
jgi:REP element-mobilizing transposase RayT